MSLSAPAPRDLAPADASSNPSRSGPGRAAMIRKDLVGAVPLVVATVVLGTTLGMASDRYVWSAYRIDVTPDWWTSLIAVTPWLLRVLLWYAVCWTATRARATSRTAALPGALAVGAVVALSVGAFVWPGVLAFAWIGPTPPLVLTDDLGVRLTVSNPAVGFPVLVAAGLAVASWLGARSGRARGVARLRRPTLAAAGGAVVVPGVLVLAAVVGAALAWWASNHEVSLTAAVQVSWLVGDLLIGLVAAILGAALLSGCGTAGTLVAVLLAIAAGAAQAAGWWGGGDDPQLVVAVCSVLATALAATWRPAALWLDDVLDPLRRD